MYIYFRHPFANTEGKFNMSKVMIGKYDLIERKEIDERLKELCYRMIKLVMIYICIGKFHICNCIYLY
jgi:hypothetical protein